MMVDHTTTTKSNSRNLNSRNRLIPENIMVHSTKIGKTPTSVASESAMYNEPGRFVRMAPNMAGNSSICR